jgi:hypothetical protein
MLFKKRIPFQQYCTASLKAAFEHSDEATGEVFRRSCGDAALSATDLQLYLTHLRTVFIELGLIAIAKNCPDDLSIQATIFVHTDLKKRNASEVAELCHSYSQAFASSSTDGIRQMVLHFNDKVAAGRLRQETIERLYCEFDAVLASHFNDFKSVKLV